MAISIFATRAMVPAMRQDKKAGRFLLDTLFNRVNISTAETVDIDIIKGKRRMAPFQSPRIEGKLIEKRGFTTNSYKPGYVKPKFATDASDLVDNRAAGENVYTGENAQNRAVTTLVEELNEHEDLITRREEWMCAQQLVNGYVDVIGEGVNYRVDLLMDANHKVTLIGADMWTDVASDPDSDIEAWTTLISKDGGASANIMIGSPTTMNVYVKHAKVASKLNTRRIDLGMIKPEDLGDGVSYYGYVIVNGKSIDLYGYEEWAEDDAGVEQPLFADGQVVLTSTMADFRRHYGAIKDLDAIEELGSNMVALPRYPKSWKQKDPSVRFVMIQSAPLPAAHQIDAIVSAKVF